MTTQTLVEQLEQGFESPEVAREVKAKTLAEYVSNHLMQNGLPRISPELFDLKREVQVPLTDEQIKKIDNLYMKSHNNPITMPSSLFDGGWEKLSSDWKNKSLNGDNMGFKTTTKFNCSYISGVKRNCKAEIPHFSYENHDREIASYEKMGIVSYEGHWDITGQSWGTEKSGRLGESNIKISEEWKAPLRLDVNVKVPEIPKGFVELGDDAIAEYYNALLIAPSDLRKTTSYESPKIGILWSPKDKVLYCTGKIPNPSVIPLSRGDPALILDFSDQDRSYRHVVAVWDIGDENPLRNWLAEYGEGGSK